MMELGSLTLITRICNVCTKSFKFTTAYQTYLVVSDIGEMRIEGMEYCNYRDRLQGGELFTEQGISLAFDSEVDRVYTDVDEAIGVFDHVRKRTIRVEKGGFPDMIAPLVTVESAEQHRQHLGETYHPN